MQHLSFLWHRNEIWSCWALGPAMCLTAA